jgi:hypothetical protein
VRVAQLMIPANSVLKKTINRSSLRKINAMSREITSNVDPNKCGCNPKFVVVVPTIMVIESLSKNQTGSSKKKIINMRTSGGLFYIQKAPPGPTGTKPKLWMGILLDCVQRNAAGGVPSSGALSFQMLGIGTKTKIHATWRITVNQFTRLEGSRDEGSDSVHLIELHITKSSYAKK